MSKSVKVFLIFLVFFFSIIISLTVAVNEKINPEKIAILVENSLKTVIPHSNVKVGKIDYSMGTMVRVYINHVEVSKDQVKLLVVKKVVCRIPLLSTVFGNGTIKIKIENPNIHKNIQQSLSSSQKSKITIEVPSFISKNKLDLNIKNIHISNKNKEVILKRVLVKNLNLTKSMAYEIIGDAKLRFGQTEVFGEAQVVGEVNLNNLKESEGIKSNIMIDLKNVKTQNGRALPRGRGKFDVVWNYKTRNLIGNGKFNINTVLDSDFKFQTDFRILQISSLQASVVNEELPRVFNGKLFKKLDYQKSVTLIKGKVKYDFLKETMIPDLELNIKKPIKYIYKKIPISFILDAKIKGNRTEIKAIKNILKGVITSNLTLQLKKNPFDFVSTNIKQVRGNILITGIDLDRGFFKAFELKQRTKTKTEVIEVDFNESETKEKYKISLLIDGKNNFIGKAKVDMQGELKLDSDHINTASFFAKTQTGSAKINLSSKKNKFSFSTNFTNIELKDFVPVFPLLIPNLTGVLSGNAKGFVEKEKYKLDIDMNLKDFIIDFVDLSAPINNFLADVGEQTIFAMKNRLNSFEEVTSKFVMNDKGLVIQNAIVKAEKAIIVLNKSFVMNNANSLIMGYLKTTKKIPFKFVGFGHTLNADIDYSKRKLNKRKKE